jgi:transposase
MQLKTILNRLEKQSGFVYGDGKWCGNAIEIELKPRKGSKPICSGCGKRRPGYDRLPARRFEYVPLWQLAVFFVYALRRVNCPDCGVVVERIPWACGKNQQTKSYRIFLATWAKRLSWQEARQMKADGYEEVLKNSRWSLLKRRSNLTTKQTVKLRELLKYNLRTVKAYLMREDFNRFWTYTSSTWASKFLREWCERANRSRIEPMQKLANTLIKHESLLLKFF